MDFGATLLWTFVNSCIVAYGQLGDGDILRVVKRDGQVDVERVFPASPEEAIGDLTYSLCSNESGDLVQIKMETRPTGDLLLILATDGVSKSYETPQDFDKIGPDILRHISAVGLPRMGEELGTILRSISGLGSGDDASMGLMYFPFCQEDPIEKTQAEGENPTEMARERMCSRSREGASDDGSENP